MAGSVKRMSKKVGLRPGSLVHVGKKKAENIKITIIDYNESGSEETTAKSVTECFPFKDKESVTWINIDGLHDTSVIEKIGKHFDIHPLVLEDVLNTKQRPKLEDFGNYIFVVIKMLSKNNETNHVESEQISIVFGKGVVISFQEKEGDVFGPVRDRIKNGRGRIRKAKSDYLAYALIDSIVDNYFSIIESINEVTETVEESVVSNPEHSVLQKINSLKGQILYVKKSVWPLRETISSLQRSDSDLVEETTKLYIRDVYDHTIQVIDTVETLRDMLSGLLDVYMSSISNKMNEVMKTLTIVATIFIPLSFIAGVYGMNFAYMPELQIRWGYFAALGLMATVGGTMLFYFKKKRWL